MKMEIEISEDEIKNSLNKAVAAAIANYANRWSVDSEISKAVSELAPGIIMNMVQETMSRSSELERKIIEKIDKRLTLQINAAIKAKDALPK